MSDLARAVVRRLETHRALRQPHETAWKECFDYTFPERGQGLCSQELSGQDIQSKKNRILDGTAPDAARILSSNMQGGTTPANSIWFSLGTDGEDETDEEKAFFDNAARVIFKNIHATNFDAASFECCVDIVPAGWFVLYIDEAKEGGFSFEEWPLGQCFISSSRLGGLVDTIFREVEMTVEQCVNAYGLDRCSEKTRQNYTNEKFDEKVKVVHAIYPREVHAVNARMSRNLPFASVHVDLDSKHLLRESGYHEFPCAVPRWMLIPGTAYATGPMSQALGPVRTINDIAALELANLDLATAGMWIAEDDGVLNPRSVKVGPRKVIVANSVDSMKPLTPGSNFQVAFTAEERLQAAIRRILLADQLQPQDGPAMTATEVHARVQLIRQLLGPIYGRLQAEYLQPLIERCFGIAYRAGVLGQAPESLLDRGYTVKYISPLARAQKLEEVSAIDQYVMGIAQSAQIDPSVVDNVDLDAAQRVRAQALGVPMSVVPSAKAIAAKRAAREQQQQDIQAQSLQGEMLSKATPAIAQQAFAA